MYSDHRLLNLSTNVIVGQIKKENDSGALQSFVKITEV